MLLLACTLWIAVGAARSARYKCGLGCLWVVIGAADDHIKMLGIPFVTKTFNLPAKPFQPKSAQISVSGLIHSID